MLMCVCPSETKYLYVVSPYPMNPVNKSLDNISKTQFKKYNNAKIHCKHNRLEEQSYDKNVKTKKRKLQKVNRIRKGLRK